MVDAPQTRDALAAATRIGNIRRFAEKELGPLPDVDFSPVFFEHPAEQALADAYDNAAPAVNGLMARREYAEVVQTLADLRPPVDALFEAVMVMGDDVERRDNRLALLGRLRELFSTFADWDKIVTA